MLGSISPFGERARGQRWGVTFAAYVAGSVTAGALVGTLLGAVGDVAVRQGTVALGVLALAAGVAAVLDAGVVGLRLPTLRRQVNEVWLNRYRGWVYGAAFGAQLGAGVVTIVTTGAVYAMLAAALLSGSPRAGLAIGATFGLARAVPLLAVSRARRPDQLYRVDGLLRRWDPAARRAGVAVQAGLAATAGAVAAL